MTRLKALLPALVAAVVLGGCSSKASPQDGPVLAGTEDARVRVTNNNWLDMTIYIERSGSSFRLGRVTSLGTEMFDIPRARLNAATSVRLVARPLGVSGSYVTHYVDVGPGQTVEFTIENQIGISTVTVF